MTEKNCKKMKIFEKIFKKSFTISKKMWGVSKMNESQKYFVLTISLMAFISIISIYWDGFFDETISVDPEYFSGMLSAVSIVFSISLWTVSNQKNKGLVFMIFVVAPFLMLLSGVGKLIQVAWGDGNSLATLGWLGMTLAISGFGLVAYVITQNLGILDEKMKTLKNL
jgi:hypothetical protein